MKKQYMKPDLEVVEMEVNTQLLAGSDVFGRVSDDDEIEGWVE